MSESGGHAAEYDGLAFKIIVPHNTHTDWHMWWFPNGYQGIGPVESRDRAGRAQGEREGYFPEWFVLACNNMDCDARAVVPVRFLTRFADAAEQALPAGGES